MSNENDDATQLGSIGRHMSKPQQPGNPQARPAFQAPSLPTHPQEQDGDEEGTVLSTHNATPSRPTRPTVPMAQPMQAQPTQSAPTQQPLPQSQSAPVMATRQFPQTTAPSVKPAQPAMASSMMSAPQADITEFHELFAQLVGNVSQVVVGKEQPIRQCATAMIVGGHILLEDNPGTGKTQLARGLANSIDMSFKRIQFTPDLLPSDVVGVTYYDQKNGEFEYREGPIFASIVLADEINRASPKTQSALLEVMEEQKVTVDGETHAVPQPFMVIATQNPIEQLGTYKLPEAQMDRFLIKTTIGYPSHDVSVNILKQVNVTDRASTVHAVLTGNDGKVKWVAVSMNPFVNDAKKIGVPVKSANAMFQTRIQNMRMLSNVPGIKTGIIGEGNIEFWPGNYGTNNSARIPGANNSTYDFGDQPNQGVGYGSMQIHNYRARQTVFAYNKFDAGRNCDLGIGNAPGKNTDWTFSGSMMNYSKALLCVLVELE